MNAIARPITASAIEPTRRASCSSCAITASFLPEELPRIALEVADQLAEVAVELVARQQRAGRALARAQVGDHAVNVVDEAAGLARRGRGLVGGADRGVGPLLGDDAGDPGRVGHQRLR